MEEILQYTVLGNTVKQYLIFTGSLLLSLLFIRIAMNRLLNRLKTWAGKAKKPFLTGMAQGAKQYLVPILYFTAIVLCLKLLTLPAALLNIVNVLTTAFTSFMSGLLLTKLAAYALRQYWRQRKSTEDSKLAIHWIGGLAKAIIWSVVGILFLQNIGVRIDALITGLGIGGLALAFSAQVVLEDVFCFFTIFFDRPFEIGDFIVAGEQMGTVEHIGVKTTRLRALDGEQLILSNKDLTSARIRNYKTMEQRRVRFTIGVTYQTSAQVLAEIPTIIKEIVESVDGTTFGRTHFLAFSASSLDFEIVYFVLSSDYDRYMDVNQQVNLKIKEVFDARGIDFAYPTQTLFMDGTTAPAGLKKPTP
ncbi:MAG: mechanosensitive ion channel family protein [Eubacteriales bacterium]|nr:mechanosensitive ion channel family protein [Eubacteriales bacterium]